uniref:C2 domain-containing protein n=1 Tax=Angiostrongylus cantonensis TaxID=6313 RepID=A0A0K0DIX2_ANGCA
MATELLRVRVTKGERLGKRDLFGVISPYCVVRLEKSDGEQIDEITLEKKKKTRDPVWNAIITLRVTRQCCLKFLIFDENKIRKDALLGSVEFDLSTENISRESNLPSMYPLKGRHSLGIDSVRELEDIVIDAIYNKLFKARLDSKGQFIEVDDWASRDTPVHAIPGIVAVLNEFKNSVADIFGQERDHI